LCGKTQRFFGLPRHGDITDDVTQTLNFHKPKKRGYPNREKRDKMGKRIKVSYF